MAIEKTIMKVNYVLEPPLKVGSGNRVEESSAHQHSVVCNDSVASNPSGSAAPEVLQVPTRKNKKQSIMKPRQYTQIATLNVRTAREDWRLNELIHQMDSYNISIVAIQEHRRVHSDELLYKHLDNHLIVTASAWRNTAQAATGGVGIVMNSAAEKVLCDVNKVSDRIIVATFAGNPKTSIIAVYSPTNVRAHTEAVDEYYEQLRNTIDDIPPHNSLIILGD